MADKMLCCDIDEFLRHYAPFCPVDDSIDSALEKLKHEQLLLSELSLDPDATAIRKSSSRPELECKIEPPLDTLEALKWRDLSGEEIPSQTNAIETNVFKRLAPIVEALTEQECFGTDSKAGRECNFSYRDCGDTQMVGEIAGSTSRIDAYFSPASSPPPSKEAKVVVSQVAVAAKFKKKEKDFHDVGTQILNIDVF